MAFTDRIRGVTAALAIKAPVRAASTANLTLSGEQTVDGVALVDGDRVLVKDQTDATQNGIYEVDTGSWTRALDFNGVGDVTGGTSVFVLSGSTNAGEQFYVSNTSAITFGTTSITFALFNTNNDITFEEYGGSPVSGVDNYAAMSTAVTAISAAGGGVLIMAPGTFKFSQFPPIPQGVQIDGSGEDVTYIKPLDSGYAGDEKFITDLPTVANAGVKNVALSNLTVDVNAEPAIEHGVYFQATSEADALENVRITGFPAYVDYTATSGQTEFVVPWPFPTVARIKAIRQSAAEVAGSGRTIDVRNDLTYSTSPSTADQFSLTGAGTGAAGTLTLGAGATTGDLVRIWRTGHGATFGTWNQYGDTEYDATVDTTANTVDVGTSIGSFANGEAFRILSTGTTPGGMDVGDNTPTGIAGTVYYYVSYLNAVSETFLAARFTKTARETVTPANASNEFTMSSAAFYTYLHDDMPVRIGTKGSLPTGITADGTFDDDPDDDVCSQVYYVINHNSSTGVFQISATVGGAAVTFSDDGSGTISIQAYEDITSVGSGDLTVMRFLVRNSNRNTTKHLRVDDAPISVFHARALYSQNSFGGSFNAHISPRLTGYCDKGIHVDFGEQNSFYSPSISTGVDFTYGGYINDTITNFYDVHVDSSKSNGRISATRGGSWNLILGFNLNNNTGLYFTATAGGSGVYGLGGNGCYNRLDFASQATFENVTFMRGDGYVWLGEPMARSYLGNADDGIVSFGGDAVRTTGAVIDLYGGSHATAPNAMRVKQDVSGTPTLRMEMVSGGDFRWYDTSATQLMELEEASGALLVGRSARVGTELLSVEGDGYFNGDLTVTGSVTGTVSLTGLTDSATAAVVTLTDTIIDVGQAGSSLSIVHVENGESIRISGGSSASGGANIWLYGGAAGQQDSFLFRQGSANRIKVFPTTGAGAGDIVGYASNGSTEHWRFDESSGALLVGTTAPVASELLRINGDAYVDGMLTVDEELVLGGAGTGTIATGSVAAPASIIFTVSPEGGSADDLDTITGGVAGRLLIVAGDGVATVTAKDGTGNLALAGDFAMDVTADRLTLVYDGTNWVELARSNNA